MNVIIGGKSWIVQYSSALSKANVKNLLFAIGGEIRRYKLILAPSIKKGFHWAKQHHLKPSDYKIITPRNFDSMRGMSNCDIYYAGEQVDFTEEQKEMLRYASK